MDQEQIWQKSPDHPARPEKLHGGDWEVRWSFWQIFLLRFSNFEQSLLLFLFRSVSSGTPLLIENLPEELDPVLDPLLGRWVVLPLKSNNINLTGCSSNEERPSSLATKRYSEYIPYSWQDNTAGGVQPHLQVVPAHQDRQPPLQARTSGQSKSRRASNCKLCLLSATKAKNCTK